MPRKKKEVTFDPTAPFITVGGKEVISKQFKDKILGVVVLDDEDGYFCSWDFDGKRLNIMPRGEDNHHYLDLVNVSTDDA